MIKLSVNETKWSSLLARTHAFILYISISVFDFGPEKLPGLSRNGPLVITKIWARLLQITICNKTENDNRLLKNSEGNSHG